MATDACFQPGQCRESQPITGDFVEDEFECFDFCKVTSACKFFSFAPDIKYCELFFNCSYVDTSVCSNCLTGSKDCQPKEPECWIPGECTGVLDHFEAAQSKEECLGLCKSMIGCGWFTFREPSSPCFLFKDCPSIDETCDSCISGERRCKQSPKG